MSTELADLLNFSIITRMKNCQAYQSVIPHLLNFSSLLQPLMVLIHCFRVRQPGLQLSVFQFQEFALLVETHWDLDCRPAGSPSFSRIL
jgi:hypothetical protein